MHHLRFQLWRCLHSTRVAIGLFVAAGGLLTAIEAGAQASSFHNVYHPFDSSTFSSFTRPLPLLGKATVVHKVEGIYVDNSGADFTWTGPGDFKFQGSMEALQFNTKSVQFDTYLSIVQDVGNIEFTKPGGNVVAGPAPFYRPVPSLILHFGADALVSMFSGSPTEIQFLSELNPLAGGSFEYIYSVTNFTTSPIDFDWSAAGLHGTVGVDTDPLNPSDNVVSRRVVFSPPAIELLGTATFKLGSATITMPADVFAPIPEPGTASLALGGLGIVMMTAWRRSRGSDVTRSATRTDLGRDEVAASKLAVDSEVEQRELAHAALHLKPDSECPDVLDLDLERCLLADDLALVPRLARQNGGC